ncbi:MULTISPECIES: NAD(P)/FAD-dependent oxidoreductase [unclassified Streptomyces]|uniref:NAD(P)/FAD-dependent oxidoreductase n=1 Tax=unclassified Streptomyces TaxID=2593676 RepID=UPI000A49E767|nr:MULTISPECIES: FAD-dependent oxidoreductase [unclassified Streptomyces]MCP3767413.1 FAD-binding oxidoreductase [Streptomyces sp. MAR25Y5]
MTRRPTDYAVIGGGVLGCLAALEILARDPGAGVVVLERDAVGSGASRRSAGLHFPRGASPRVREMAAYSQRWYAAAKAARPELPVHGLGMTVLAPVAAGAGLRRAYLPEAGLRPAAGVPAPLDRLPGGMSAWEGDGCQYADVHALTQLLARDLRRTAKFHEGAEVTGVHPGADGVRLELGTGGDLSVGHVVLAPGPWLSAPAWKHLVAPLGARVKKVVALHIEVPPAPGDGAVVFQDEDAFLLPYHERGHWLFSYTCDEWDVDPEALTPGISAADRSDALATLGRYAPHLVEHCLSGRVFCDAYAPDREPIVRALTGDGRVVFAGAANGSGYRLAPAVAAQAAGLLPLPSQRKDAA